MTEARKLFVRTYGCQMNVYDSERMTEALGTPAGGGYVVTDRAEDADLILLNTCHIREKAAEKVYSELGRLKPLKDANPGLRIAVAGCVAQAEGDEIRRRQPAVDLVVGPQAYHRLPDLAARARAGTPATDTAFPVEDKFDRLGARPTAPRGPTAFLTVQEGCDKFCAFCVVPYTRGAESSRPAARILDEARGLAARGVREVTLLGQNVNAYHGHPGGLAGLVRDLARIEGIVRIRYTTSHPNDMDDALIAAHGEVRELMPYLHLPVQSGSDKVLQAMNRKHTADAYLRLIERIRAARPDILVSGDFIVGFPGETEADFAETMALAEAVEYGACYSFRYSPRPGTPAADRPQVDADAAADRLARLQALLGAQQRAVQARMVGRHVDVLVDRAGREPGQITGKSDHLHAVFATADLPRGAIARMRIVRSAANSLEGVPA